MRAAFPLIHAGTGIIHTSAYRELQALAELIHAPVTTSWSARGALPDSHPLSFPMIYVDENQALRNAADCVLVLASRLGETDFWGKAPYWARPQKQHMIQVDIDDAFLGRNKPTTLAVLADVKSFLSALIAQLKRQKGAIATDARKKKVGKYRQKKEKARAKLDKKLEDLETPMNPAHVATVCRTVFPDDAIVILDGGNTQVWGQFYHEVRVPNTQMASHKFGMLGSGVGQALGAAVARPEKWVYAIIGDGAMGFHVQEIETAVRNGLNVIYLVLCDQQWGMVKMGQQFALKPMKTIFKKSLGPEETINTDLCEIRFDKVAKSMGANGERVSDPRKLAPTIERCLKKGGCSVIHVNVDPVKHMWAPKLMFFHKMHEEPKGK